MKIVSGVLALLGVGVLLAVVLTGGGVARADFPAEVSADAVAPADAEASADAASPTDSAELLTALAALESGLPDAPAPTGVEIDPSATWGRLEGDATGSRTTLDALEPELRRLFVRADEADGPVAEAVTLVARGWLGIWSGLGPLAEFERHDLAFPSGTDDADGVATGGDELRGAAERGLEQVLDGQRRLHLGYTQLRTLGEAEPDVQVHLDVRAAAADTFDAEIRPLLHQLLSQSSPTVLVTTDRFETGDPGAQARARSSSFVCVDRQAHATVDGELTDEQLAALAEAARDRVDCPDLPAGTTAP